MTINKEKIIGLIATTPGVMRIWPVKASSGAIVSVAPDFRKLYSQPAALRLIGKLIGKTARQNKIRLLAGIETAGIPIVASASIASGIPMVYLRKKPHRGWSGSIIDGQYRRGDRTALVDDAVTFGGQKNEFRKSLKNKLKLVACVVIWDACYPKKYLKYRGRILPTIALVKKLEVMDYMLKHKLMRRDTYEVMQAQTLEPWGWNKNKEIWRKMLAIKRRGSL